MVFVEASGPAPPELCWERYAVPAAWPGWAPQIRAVVVEGAGRAPAGAVAGAGGRRGPGAPGRTRIVPGLRGRVRPLAGPAVRFLVTAVDESERTWSWRVGIGPWRLNLDHGVDACLDGGTSTWVRITGPAPLPHAYAPLARAALRHLVR